MDNLIKLNLQHFAEEGETGLDTAEPTAEEDTGENLENNEEQEETQAQEKVQSSEDNTKFAMARRKAEEEKQAEIRRRDSQFALKFGHLKNPRTNQPIRSQQDYFDALEAQESVVHEQALSSAGIDPKIIQDMIQNSPAVRELSTIKERLQAEEKQREFALGLDYVTREVKEISKLDPSIKTNDDLDKLDKISEIIELCSTRGLTVSQAYKQVYFDDILSRQTSRSKQSAINQVKGKSHLQQAGGLNEGDNEVFVPESTLKTLREYYPDLSDSELKKKAAKHM